MQQMVQILANQAREAKELMEQYLKQMFPDSHYKRVSCFNDEKRLTMYAEQNEQ